MTTLFISDLHLDPSRPAVTRAFLDLLQGDARQADALYILGDFFEAWIGDDDDAPLCSQICTALKAFTDSGVATYFMRGNRDFLVGEQFAEETGCTLLDDPCVIDLYDKPTLLMHGDLLCTDDTRYMEFRAQCRSREWQQAVLSRSLDERRALAQQLRQDSREANSNKAEDIMDVNPTAVNDYLTQYGVELLIHGHTHRPAIHQINSAGCRGERIVLGDWDQNSWILRYTPEHGYSLDRAPIN